MSVFEKPNAADRAALEKLSAQELKELLRRLSDADAPTDAESRTMLEILELLEQREDGDYIRLDARAALRSFRREFLPAAETDPDAAEETPARPAAGRTGRRRRAAPEKESGSLPAFIAAFAAGKRLSEQEVDEIQRMIDDYRKEL